MQEANSRNCAPTFVAMINIIQELHSFHQQNLGSLLLNPPERLFDCLNPPRMVRHCAAFLQLLR